MVLFVFDHEDSVSIVHQPRSAANGIYVFIYSLTLSIVFLNPYQGDRHCLFLHPHIFSVLLRQPAVVDCRPILGVIDHKGTLLPGTS